MHDPQQLLNEATALHQQGRTKEALAKMRAVAERVPDSFEVLNNLGAMEQAAGNLKRARDSYRRAIRVDAGSFVPCVNLAEVLVELGEQDAAIDALRIAATLAPAQAIAWSRLGLALCQPRTAIQAIAPLQRALELDAQDGAATRALADAYQYSSQFEQSVPCYRRALELGVTEAEVHASLGHALLEIGESALAVDALRACLVDFPKHDRAHYDLGKALFDQGCVEQGVEHMKLAAKSPDPAVVFGAAQSLAVVLPGSPADDQAAILEIRKQFAKRIPKHARPKPAPRDGSRKQIRIGYLSSFFHRDNWMKPVWALLARHDRERFEIHLLNDSPGAELAPGYTPEASDHVHALQALDNEAACAMIAALDLDLLIDLNGYSAQARLPLLRSNLARHVVEWFNMYSTTGIEEIEYLIGDRRVVDLDEEDFYSESILCVEGSYLSYEVNYPTPDVAPAPCSSTGALRFGSLASLYKLTDGVVASWSFLLKQAPGTSLLLKNAGLDNAANREFLLRRFESMGVERERIELSGSAEHYEFLRAYDAIDVALDPFPYSGGTTTSEALWQGVPVLSLRGDRWASRTSASIMHAAGLTEFCATSEAAYCAEGLRLAQDPEAPLRLAELRRSMRDRLRQSSLFDIQSFAAQMEGLYARIATS
ncbi:MAG: protein O-GlcNAc transferase [Planctomycetota bacterium]|jgi:protein O-GlcNAc transferase